MKAFIFILSTLVISCACHKKIPAAKTGMTTANSLDEINVKERESGVQQKNCLDSLIRAFEAEKVQNPPRKIYRYTYRNKTVLYVPSICCDFFSDMYDNNCKLIGHPDGGFTGKGDGTMTDFFESRKDEQLIWADKRGGK